MKKMDTKIERYKDGEWYIDIIEKSDPISADYEAWLSNKYCGISVMLFGANEPKEEILKMVKSDIEEDKKLYIEKYFDQTMFEI